MNKQLRLRWLFLILLLESALFLSTSNMDELVFFSPPINQISVSLPLTPTMRTTLDYKVITQYSFENQASLKQWEEKIFKGSTQFQVLSESGNGFLKSKSSDACSGLYVRVDCPATPTLCLSWRWRVLLFPKKKNPKNLSNKSEDDFAARVYVIFLGANFFKSDVIEYIWDEKMPVGTTAPSPYSDRIKLVVLRSGSRPEQDDGWFKEERNVYKDYQMLYGRTPQKPVGAIAWMSDSDNTGTTSEADFADIALKTKSVQ